MIFIAVVYLSLFLLIINATSSACRFINDDLRKQFWCTRSNVAAINVNFIQSRLLWFHCGYIWISWRMFRHIAGLTHANIWHKELKFMVPECPSVCHCLFKCTSPARHLKKVTSRFRHRWIRLNFNVVLNLCDCEN